MTIETKKVASVNEAIAIINRLNYRHDTFCYEQTTREDNADIKYRHFDAYRDNGEKDGFAMIEIVVNGKLEVVRFFNLFRDITVDIKFGDFTPDYSRFDTVIDVDNELVREIRDKYSAKINEIAEEQSREIAALENELKAAGADSCEIYSKVCDKWSELADKNQPKLIALENEYKAQRAEVEAKFAELVNVTVEEADPADYAISNEAMTVAVEAEIKATTVEKFFKAIEEVKYFRNSAGAKIWHVKSGFDWKRVSKVHAARWLAEYGLTMDEFFSIENYLIEEDRRKVVEYDRNEIMSTPLVSEEAQEVAINAEIEQANAQPVEILEETDGSEDDADEEAIAAVIPTEDNDYDETDEPEILNADLFVNLYRSPIQEHYASVTRTINGEQLYFFQHRLTNISAPALNLEVSFDNGRMNFWHGDKRIARDKVWQVPIIKETAKAQTESFGKFFAGDLTSKFFKVSMYPTFADGSEHNYVRYFDFFNQAQKFVEEVKTFVGDVPTRIYITGGGQYLFTRINGTEHYTLPAVDVTEAQSRLDELNKAIADNESFADKCDDLTASLLRVANYRNKKSIAYYEAALRMTEPATDAPTPDKPADKLAQLKAKADAAKKTAAEAKAELVKAQKAHAEAVNAADRAALDYEYFGHDIAAALTAHNLPECELDVVTQTGFSWIIHTDAIKVSFDEDKFKLHCYVSEGDFHLGSYDTPEEVTNVIEQLKAAIARGDKEFKFPTVDEPINQPDNSTPDKLRDSLARGMKECLIRTQEHIRANDISAALVENERYQICANALHDVKEMIA